MARGSAAELAERYAASEPRGEVVLVVGAARERAGSHEQALDALRELIGAGAKPRAAAAVVARLTGTRANELYRRLTGAISAAGREQ